MKHIGSVCFAFLLASTVLFGGCQSADTKNDTTEYTGVQQALRSVFTVSCNDDVNGSGLLLDTDENGGAYVATNLHVLSDFLSDDGNIEKDASVVIRPYGADEASYAKVDVTGVFKAFDFAMLYVENLTNLFPESKSVVYSRENVVAGKKIHVVGNALGKGLSVTFGTVSLPSEYVTMSVPYQLSPITLRQIRVDASMNQGCSGGGAFDNNGALVGMVNARNNEDGVDDFGYVIPAGTVEPLANKLIAAHKRQADTAYLFDFGATFTEQNVSYAWADGDNILHTAYDVTVSKPETGSIASVFLQEGDVITGISVNGGKQTQITKRYLLEEIFYALETGDEITFAFERGHTPLQYSLTVTEAYMKKINLA